MTKSTTLKILLIEDNPGDARLVREMLREVVETHRYELHHVWCLDDALEHLQREEFDVALVDLSLPDTQGLGTVNHPEFDVLLRLKECGVAIVVDAFGTGYSSVRRLCRLGVDVLKIDRTLVEGIGGGTDDVAIEAIVSLGHGMGVSVVAGGVETPQQLDRLRDCGCDGAQGFLLAEPRAAEDLPTLRSWDGLAVAGMPCA